MKYWSWLTLSSQYLLLDKGLDFMSCLQILHPELSTYHTVINVHAFGFKCLDAMEIRKITKNFLRLTQTLSTNPPHISCYNSPHYHFSEMFWFIPVEHFVCCSLTLYFCHGTSNVPNQPFPTACMLLTPKANVSCLLPSLLSVTIIIFCKIRKSHFYHRRARLLRSQDSPGLILTYESWTFPNKYRHSSDDQASLPRLPELSTLIITMVKGSKVAAN